MAGNVHNTNTLSGGAMAVLAGVVLIIGPWFLTSMGFFSKLIISIIGIALIIAGTKK